MRVLLVLLAIASLTGCSKSNEWVESATSQDGFTTNYYNPSTGSRSGGVVKVMELADYRNPRGIQRGNPYLSAKSQSEYDCDRMAYRYLSVIAFSGNMGTGAVVGTEENPSQWAAMPETSQAFRIAKKICSGL